MDATDSSARSYTAEEERQFFSHFMALAAQRMRETENREEAAAQDAAAAPPNAAQGNLLDRFLGGFAGSGNPPAPPAPHPAPARSAREAVALGDQSSSFARPVTPGPGPGTGGAIEGARPSDLEPRDPDTVAQKKQKIDKALAAATSYERMGRSEKVRYRLAPDDERPKQAGCKKESSI